jgi:hypothetical protein
MRWQDTAILEIALATLTREFPEATRRLEEARDRFRRGDWEGTLQACRMVQEAVARVYSEGQDRPKMNKLRDAIRARTKRNNGNSLATIVEDINPILRGWFEYFKHSHWNVFPSVDGWVRMRLRSILRKRQGRRGRGLSPGAPTSGPAPGAGRLLNQVMKPVV